MACDNVIDWLARETGLFSEQIYNRVFARSPWIGLIKKDAFPQGMGDTISVLTYERQAPIEAAPTWTAMDPTTYAENNAGIEGGLCLPNPTTIAVASTTRTFTPYRRVLQGPDFCVDNLRYPFQAAEQVNMILDTLSEYTMKEWEIRYRHEYFRLTGRKVVVTATGTTEGTSTDWPAECPGSILTQGVLNKYKVKLQRDGALMSALGAGTLTLITDAETADDLVFRNSDIRQDLRWGAPSELLKALGVERSYRGFYHVIDPYPMRYTCSQGVYTEVAAFTTTAATIGSKAIVNTAWEAAPIGSSFVFDPTVLTSLIPQPISSVGRAKFNPHSYMGDFKLMNILDRTCNPDGTIVYHRATLAQASKPVHPERGVAFAHLRCDPSLNLVTSCS
jgi:hypothetical protein